ncbi:hypothetical protein [Pseudodesulfovibrio sp. zrk46]|uniref:hypothetical protein n=1 Tax=Pseudodesulfovibrio sp. zrk46 TaxID=2725288 RepID=UPI00144A2692|nr:hypothetical protein [Pseudodesulfovibrio sp. zrk46]QJB55828.1 hypothetical protein HFN16_05140 [Pseudodesulfovibrio sp. zrk46]
MMKTYGLRNNPSTRPQPPPWATLTAITTGILTDKGARLRIKIWEIFIGLVMTIHGVGMIVTGDYSFKGWPIYGWVAYAYAFVGISIIPIAWFLRSPSRKNKEDQ